MRFVPLLLMVASYVQAADVVIAGPSAPIGQNTQIALIVRGFTDQELTQATATCQPSRGVQLAPTNFKDGSGATILFFTSSEPGTHTVTVSINASHLAWQQSIGDAISGASVARVDSVLLRELETVSAKLAGAYPAKSGSCVVTVAGSVVVVPPGPDIPPDPRPAPPIMVGSVFTVIIRTEGTLTTEQAEVLRELREWSDTQPRDKLAHHEYPPDAETPDGQLDKGVQSYVAKIPATSSVPYVFISRKVTGSKAVILYQSDLPTSADVLIAKIKQYMDPSPSIIPRGNVK